MFDRPRRLRFGPAQPNYSRSLPPTNLFKIRPPLFQFTNLASTYVGRQKIINLKKKKNHGNLNTLALYTKAVSNNLFKLES